MTTPTTGPFVVSALLCERVLKEADGVLSLIRIIDRVNVSASGPKVPDEMPQGNLNYQLVVMLKSGSATGPVRLKVTLTLPSGLEHSDPVYEGTVHLEGGVRGYNHVMAMSLGVKSAGPYWFNVFIEDELVTRTPLEVVYTVQRKARTG